MSDRASAIHRVPQSEQRNDWKVQERSQPAGVGDLGESSSPEQPRLVFQQRYRPHPAVRASGTGTRPAPTSRRSMRAARNAP
jgi:hypothetical protein